jgi:hypothetical protein
MGIITTERFLVGPCEIMAEYGDQYDWDEVKWKGFEDMRDKMIRKEGCLAECVKSTSMAKARRGNGFEKIMARTVDGKVTANEWHSTIPEECGEDSMAAYITSGVEMERFMFGKYGRPHKDYPIINVGRPDGRVGGNLEYARKWNGKGVVRGSFGGTMRMNPHINSVAIMIRHEKRVAQVAIKKNSRVDKTMKEMRGGRKDGQQYEHRHCTSSGVCHRYKHGEWRNSRGRGKRGCKERGNIGVQGYVNR